MLCNQCSATPEDEMRLYPHCSGSMNERTAKRKKRGLAVTLSVISGLLVMALLTCWLTNFFGFYGPTARIAKCFQDTFVGGNFTVKLTTQLESKTSELTLKIDIDTEHEELTVLALNQEDLIAFSIYDGYFIYSPVVLFSLPHAPSSNGYYAYNISKYIDKFFEAADSAEDFDLEELLDSIDKELYDQLEQNVHIDRLENASLQLYRNLNSNAWLKEHTGYSKERVGGVTVYHFEPDLYELCSTVLEGYEDCFRNEEAYDTAVDKLNESKDLRSADIALSFGIDHGKLVSMQYTQKSEGATNSIQMAFSDVGVTKIDTDLAKLLDGAYIFGSK